MINNVLDFTAYFKNKSGFNAVEDNLDETLSFSDKVFNFIANNTKEDFLYKWDREVTDEDLKWERIGNLKLDWELTLENIS